MALVGNMIATSYTGNSAMVNYDIFVSVFGMLSLLYLLPTTFLDSYNIPIVNIALDALNVLFWFIAGVATAAYLGVHSCSNRVCIPLSCSFFNSSRK
jgi:formate-dependent nitrite reductase membrane component NrfD